VLKQSEGGCGFSRLSGSLYFNLTASAIRPKDMACVRTQFKDYISSVGRAVDVSVNMGTFILVMHMMCVVSVS